MNEPVTLEAVMAQVQQLSAADKLRLLEQIALTLLVERPFEKTKTYPRSYG